MPTPTVSLVTDPPAGWPAWTATLTRTVGTVGTLLPGGYERYTQVRHPAYGADGERIADLPDLSVMPSAFRYTPPRRGSFEEEDWHLVADVLQRHSAPTTLYAAVWLGNLAPDAEVAAPARLNVPMRSYAVLRVDHADVPTLPAVLVNAGWVSDWSFQNPNFMWPQDAAWVLATEVDFDTTLIASNERVSEALRGLGELRTMPSNRADDTASHYPRLR